MRGQTHPFAIVLCTCNGEAYLDAQLATLRSQAGVAEIVVVDDASTDGTCAILQSHAAEDGRLRIHRNAERRGVTANFERAIGLAQAPWVALADQDDLWEPDKLARLRAAWDGESVLMHHATRRFSGRPELAWGGSVARDGRKFRGQDWRRLLYRNSVVGHTAVFRRELAAWAAPFPEGVLHDWWLGVAAALHGSVQYVDEYLVHYRLHATNAFHATGSRWRRLRQEQEMREHLLRALLARQLAPPALRGLVAEFHAIVRGGGRMASVGRHWRFYRAHAPLFFAGVGQSPSKWRCLRKSGAAALASWVRPFRHPSLVAEESLVPRAPRFEGF